MSCLCTEMSAWWWLLVIETYSKLYFIEYIVVSWLNDILVSKNCRENQNTHLMFNNLFRKSCRLWDNMAKYGRAGRPQMTIWHMHITCWIPTAADTHWFTFPLQQWLHERTSMLRYTHITCLVMLYWYCWQTALPPVSHLQREFPNLAEITLLQ